MDAHEKHVADKRKEREAKNAEQKHREEVVENDQNRSGSMPRHIVFFTIGTILLIAVLATWTFWF